MIYMLCVLLGLVVGFVTGGWTFYLELRRTGYSRVLDAPCVHCSINVASLILHRNAGFICEGCLRRKGS